MSILLTYPLTIQAVECKECLDGLAHIIKRSMLSLEGTIWIHS